MPRLREHPRAIARRERPPDVQTQGATQLVNPDLDRLGLYLRAAGLSPSEAADVAGKLDRNEYTAATRILSGRGIEVVRRREWYGVYYKIRWTR